jgi:hypothetical protein
MQINLKLEVLKIVTLEFSLSSDNNKEKKKDENSKGLVQSANTSTTKQ